MPQTLALVALVLLGFAVLVGLDLVLRYGLWGEWVFAMIGCSLATWGLARLALPHLPARFQIARRGCGRCRFGPRWCSSVFRSRR